MQGQLLFGQRLVHVPQEQLHLTGASPDPTISLLSSAVSYAGPVLSAAIAKSSYRGA